MKKFESARMLKEFQESILQKSDVGKYSEIEVVDFLCHAQSDMCGKVWMIDPTKKVSDFKKTQIAYQEVIAKLCYICGDKLVLHVDVDDKRTLNDKERRWGSQPRIVNDKVVVSPKRFAYWLQLFSFDLISRKNVGANLEIFEARRMPRVVWDKKTLLSDYPSNTIVDCPLYGVPWFDKHAHPSQERHRYKTRYTDPEEFGPMDKRSNVNWWRRVDWLMENFKIWMWEPIIFCKNWPSFYNGSHRFTVARELKMERIDVRILEKRFGRGNERFVHPLF